MWSRADVIGLSINVVSFSRNLVLSGLSFSANVVRKRAMLLVPAVYVLRPLHIGCEISQVRREKLMSGAFKGFKGAAGGRDACDQRQLDSFDRGW